MTAACALRQPTPPEAVTDRLAEVLKCRASFAYFADTYCFIQAEGDGLGQAWGRFRLWADQLKAARLIQDHRLVVILKARQLGLTWLVLAYALWLMLLHPIATILLFSRTDADAMKLLTRLEGMYQRLPDWLKARAIVVDSGHEFKLSTESVALAFPTNRGDGYTATLAFVDEADLAPDLDRTMASVKPTIDAGGRMVLLSRADKSQPNSLFERVYVQAKRKASSCRPLFLPWTARPSRTGEWYELQRRDAVATTGSEDVLLEQYPATDAEALAPALAGQALRGEVGVGLLPRGPAANGRPAPPGALRRRGRPVPAVSYRFPEAAAGPPLRHRRRPGGGEPDVGRVGRDGAGRGDR